MVSVEQQHEKARKRTGRELPNVPVEKPAPRSVSESSPKSHEADREEWSARREALKKNIEGFLENRDLEGLLVFVERMAHFDALTGVLNRKGFIAEAEPIMDRILRLDDGKDRRTGEYVSFNVLFLDLDHFKNINDVYGHAVGDAALAKTAEVLRSVLRDDDIVGRWGGEEFVVAFTCSSGKNLIKRNRFIVAEKVRKTLERTDFEFQGAHIPLTVSIGVAQRKPGEELLSEVVDRADKAMYAAKEKGRNQVVVAEQEGIVPQY